MNFVKQIIIDIKGGSVSTDPVVKKTYNRNIIMLLTGTTLVTGGVALFVPIVWLAMAVSAVTLGRKVQLYYTNTF